MVNRKQSAPNLNEARRPASIIKSATFSITVFAFVNNAGSQRRLHQLHKYKVTSLFASKLRCRFSCEGVALSVMKTLQRFIASRRFDFFCVAFLYVAIVSVFLLVKHFPGIYQMPACAHVLLFGNAVLSFQVFVDHYMTELVVPMQI